MTTLPVAALLLASVVLLVMFGRMTKFAAAIAVIAGVTLASTTIGQPVNSAVSMASVQLSNALGYIF